MSDPHYIVVPLDARPVCYEQIQDLARIGDLKLSMPPANLLGMLKQPAPIDTLREWWKEALARNPNSSIILSLDMLTYGGLIPSRVNVENIDTLGDRAHEFLTHLKSSQKPRYGFSSILRIPDYNSDEEEPNYWAYYGKMLSTFSEETHRSGNMPDYLFNKIPGLVIQDFLGRRQKNLEVNERYIGLIEQKVLDFLLYCQDDTGAYGLNVQEAEFLKKESQKRRLQQKIVTQTGADEAAMLLLAKAVWSKELRSIKVYPWFFPEHGKKAYARFDGIPLGNVVQRHIQTLGGIASLSVKDADLILVINAPSQDMGDHNTQELVTREKPMIAELVEALKTWIPQKHVAVADVVHANGGDPATLLQCLEDKVPLNKLAGYAGWNTPGNSIGCALAMGAMVHWAESHGTLNHDAREALLLKRLLDDWVYQSEVRIRLKRRSQELPTNEELNLEMQDRVNALKVLFQKPELSPSFAFPCQRYFEIAVTL
jgi:hypothetical protein